MLKRLYAFINVCSIVSSIVPTLLKAMGWPLTMQELVLQRWEGVPPLLGDAQTAKIRLNRPILTEAALEIN